MLAGGMVACAAEPPIASPPVPDLGVQRRAGTTLLQTKAFYGIPILQKSFAWDGNGETDDAGLGLHAAHFVTDDVALGGGLNAATWLTPGANVYSGKVEGLLRLYPYHGPFFVDLTAGFQQATEDIPPGGTEWNFSFSFGPGVDVPIARGCSLELGATYHHISNALGRDNDRNPSQNEARLWVGFAWTL
jgi:hypothetical protein